MRTGGHTPKFHSNRTHLFVNVRAYLANKDPSGRMIRNPTVHSIACFLAFSSYGVSGTTSGVALMVVWDLKKKRRGNNKQGWASGKREGWGLSKYTLTSSQACITYC